MAKKNAVVEISEVHADNVIAAALALEAGARRLRDHAKAVRSNLREGRHYLPAEIENFASWQVVTVTHATSEAVKALEAPAS